MDRGGGAPSKPPSKVWRVALQRTGGMMAAGAWAARLEIDPNDVVDAIRSGKEEGKSELLLGGHSDAKRPASPESSILVEDSAEEAESEQLKWETEPAKQRSILDARRVAPMRGSQLQSHPAPKYLFGEKGVPARPVASPYDPPARLFGESRSPSKFAKPAIPPGEGVETVVVREGTGKPKVEEKVTLGKTAVPPPEDWDRRRGKKFDVPLPRGSARKSRTLKEQEEIDLDKFFDKTSEIYTFFKKLGVPMDLIDAQR